MMLPVIQTRRAREDIRGILRELRQYSKAAATRLAGELNVRIRRLGTFPLMGRARPEYGEGIRSLVVGDYVAIYHAGDDAVRLIRVFYGGRDIDAAWLATGWNRYV